MRSRRERSSAWFAVAAFLAATALPWVAAASPTSRFVYVRGPGAESCPDEPAMRAAVAARLGYDPFRVVATTTLTAQISRENGVYRGQVKLVDESGVERGARSIESRADDCAELTQALALSMSIAIDPLSVLSPPKPTEPEPKEPEPAATPRPKVDPTPSVRPIPPEVPKPPTRERHVERPRFALGARAHGVSGIGPAPAFGVGLSFELVWAQASLGIGARVDFPASAASPEGGRVRATFVGGEVVPCLRVPLGGNRVGPLDPARVAAFMGCGLVLLGRVSAESLDVTSPRTSGTFFAGAGVRAGFDLPLGASLSARVSGDLVGHFTPYGLAVNGATVFSSSSFSGAVGLGLVRFF